MFLKTLLFVSVLPLTALGQIDWQKPFQDCRITGSTTIYNDKNQKWLFSNEADSQRETLPASTFKIINSLIALETGVIHDENDMVRWVGQVDTVLYGYRPDIYHDMTVKEAFQQSAGWVYIELAKRIGKTRYQRYLTQCHYGNGNLSEPGTDFWNFGSFGVSPANQVSFLKALYDEKLPFSEQNTAIVKRMMIAERGSDYVLRAKTGWTREGGNDTGWWVGYVERTGNTYFLRPGSSKIDRHQTRILRTVANELRETSYANWGLLTDLLVAFSPSN